ncbi:MAG: ornithine cyclodeaminase [Anaerolineae bacterium]
MTGRSEIEFLYLTQADVKATDLDMATVLEIIEDVFRLHADGRVILPHKIVLDLGERERGRINAMPAYVGGDVDVCGIKWIAGFPQNPLKHGLPRGIGLLALNDSWKGVPLAIMDATFISAMRTGAVTGVGARYLARPESETMAMIGAGVQARTQLEALHLALPQLREVRVYDIRPEAAEAYAEEMSQVLDLVIEVVNIPQKAVEGADVIVTATMADEPIVKEAWVKEGSFFAHVGSYQEEEYEVVLNSDKIVVDEWEHVRHRGTPILARMYDDGHLSEADIYANLGEVVAGQKPGRESEAERIFFAPIGMGSEDVAVAYGVYRLALEKGLGTKLSLF